jgi:hypothetical protein
MLKKRQQVRRPNLERLDDRCLLAAIVNDGYVTFTENGASTIVAPAATVNAGEATNFADGVFTAQVSQNASANDRLLIQSDGTGAGRVSLSGGSVLYQGTPIGTLTSGEGQSVSVNLNASATVAATQALVRHIVFRSIGDNLSTLARQIKLEVDQAGGATGTPGFATVDVVAVNDAPVLNAGFMAVLNPIVEDATNPPGTPVSNIANPVITDPDGPESAKGIAVIGVTGNGSWQFSLNGGTSWQALGTVSSSVGLLLPANDATRVRFVPETNFNGQVGMTYRAWDQTTGTAGSKAEIAAVGGTSAFSSASALAVLNIAPVNDAPVLTATHPVLTTIEEDAQSPLGTPVSQLVGGVSDVDADAQKGIAVVATGGTSVGQWQFTTNGGASWQAMGEVSESSMRLLAANDSTRVRFVSGPNFNGEVRLYFRAWDRTQGEAGGLYNPAGKYGERNAFSVAFDSAVQTITPVNDAPVIGVADSSPVGYKLDTLPGVNFMLGSATVTDVDSENFDGGKLIVVFRGGGAMSKVVEASGNFLFDDIAVTYKGTVIGMRNNNGGQATDLTVTFNANATRDLVERLVRSLRYRTVNGSVGESVLDVTVSDGDGGTSATVTRTINVS